MKLEQIDTVDLDENGTCTQCDASGGVINAQETDEESSMSLCAACFTDLPGTLNGRGPEHFLKQFGTRDRIYIDDEDNLVIRMSSDLGTFNHVFYTTSKLRASEDNQGRRGAKLESGVGLTGASDVFRLDGSFVYTPSPYDDLAKRVASDG